MLFYKYHGLGNDYLVMKKEELAEELTPQLISRICHRNFGIGADGIVLCHIENNIVKARIYNSDGSEAEISGNGLRILSYSIVEKGWLKENEFHIKTPFRTVYSKVDLIRQEVTIDMGKPEFHSDKIPVKISAEKALRQKYAFLDNEYTFSCVSIGNPHCVLIMDEKVTYETVKKLGPVIESAAIFPAKTNVQFVNVLSKDEIRIEIWERGSGYTLASGSSSCAAASVCRELGYCGDKIHVKMPGGTIEIQFDSNENIFMKGKVEKIAEGKLFL